MSSFRLFLCTIYAYTKLHDVQEHGGTFQKQILIDLLSTHIRIHAAVCLENKWNWETDSTGHVMKENGSARDKANIQHEVDRNITMEFPRVLSLITVSVSMNLPSMLYPFVWTIGIMAHLCRRDLLDLPFIQFCLMLNSSFLFLTSWLDTWVLLKAYFLYFNCVFFRGHHYCHRISCSHFMTFVRFTSMFHTIKPTLSAIMSLLLFV